MTRHEPDWDLLHDSPLDASTSGCKHLWMQAPFGADTVSRAEPDVTHLCLRLPSRPDPALPVAAV